MKSEKDSALNEYVYKERDVEKEFKHQKGV
jgi:hypothetical protein